VHRRYQCQGRGTNCRGAKVLKGRTLKKKRKNVTVSKEKEDGSDTKSGVRGITGNQRQGIGRIARLQCEMQGGGVIFDGERLWGENSQGRGKKEIIEQSLGKKRTTKAKWGGFLECKPRVFLEKTRGKEGGIQEIAN